MTARQGVRIDAVTTLFSKTRAASSNTPSGQLSTSQNYAAFNLRIFISSSSAVAMATKRPICNYDGVLKELAITDTLPGRALVSREVPTGTKDGNNTTFTLASTPSSGSEQVYLNGVLQNVGVSNDYTILTNAITMNTAPVSTDVLLVTYWV